MNVLDEVPFKIPQGPLEGPQDKVELVTAPELTMLDREKILLETKYEFCLENWVLTGTQEGSACPRPSSEPRPSCPPYWLMFSSPQENRLARLRSSDLWEALPRQRSRSLPATEGHCMHPRVKLLISDSEGEGGYSEDDESSSMEEDGVSPRGREAQWHRSRTPRECRRSSSPHLRRQQSPCQHSRRRTAPPLDSQDSGQPIQSESILQLTTQRHPKRRLPALGHISRRRSLTPQPPCSSPPRSRPPPRPSTAEYKPSVLSLSRYSQLPPPRSVRRVHDSHATLPDSSAELLSALSQDERDLLDAITDQGYPLHTAIIALQKTGCQSAERIRGYLLAHDRLCKLGYDETQVEEALEMFQNCEAKAAEFLHLLTQFKEMGFQQNVIKEALLVHENDRERALEELMTQAG
ncbi:ubiquitin-associated protein 1-like [Brienomyrus brachyistius]|uniref:ubiquitin-associated protein 1-like n=1 Tax=Brienomyrus brachyistius TaxID=42636 RepID=UPI0020B1A21B|nr:ubiquitin-associated protein 1-like [Brienomyrus brachyistius]